MDHSLHIWQVDIPSYKGTLVDKIKETIYFNIELKIHSIFAYFDNISGKINSFVILSMDTLTFTHSEWLRCNYVAGATALTEAAQSIKLNYICIIKLTQAYVNINTDETN